MRYIPFILLVCLAGCHQSQCSILDHNGSSHVVTDKKPEADKPEKPDDPDTCDTCPICHKPDHTNNGHHYGLHKHQPPKGNG